MCNLGILWSCEATDPYVALARRPEFLRVIRSHFGWVVDEEASKAIYTELVANVARHAPGPVSVGLECDGKAVTLKVTDNGSGFTFSPRLPPHDREAGRGLFIVSQLATDVWVETLPNRGSTIAAKLPSRLALVPPKPNQP